MNPIRAALCVFVLVLVLIGAMVKMAEAAEPETERTNCDAEGGCVYVTMNDLRAALTKAFRAGRAEGIGGCFKSTS